jgi:DNA-directed RNA polymerase subunit RPC12/RpoP
MLSEHKFLRFILPARAFEAIKTDTKQWLIECKCGHLRDLWNEGGVRYKASGEPRQYIKCPECRQKTWHKIRLKTDSEKNQIL